MKQLILAVLATMLLVPRSFAGGTGVELVKDSLLPIVVEEVRQAEKGLGLTGDFIRAKVELQLRRNGLKPKELANEGYYVYVNVGVTGSAFSWSVEFNRWVSYKLKGVTFSKIATTYSKSGRGTVGRGVPQ